jgi:hypothetical protein
MVKLLKSVNQKVCSKEKCYIDIVIDIPSSDVVDHVDDNASNKDEEEVCWSGAGSWL